jgi:hypothetical protein
MDSSSEVCSHCPLPDCAALQQRDQDALSGEDAGAQVGDRNADPHGPVAGQAGHGHQAAHALRDLVEARPRRIGPVWPKPEMLA